MDYTHRKTALDALTYALSSLKKELHALRLEIEAGQVPRVKGRAASKRLVARMDRMREAHSVLSCDQGAERTARQSEEIDSDFTDVASEPTEGFKVAPMTKCDHKWTEQKHTGVESRCCHGCGSYEIEEEVRALSGSYEQAVAERDEARRALRNVQALALAKKLAKVYPEYADHLLRFCLEGGVTVEVLRDAEAVEASVKP